MPDEPGSAKPSSDAPAKSEAQAPDDLIDLTDKTAPPTTAPELSKTPDDVQDPADRAHVVADAEPEGEASAAIDPMNSSVATIKPSKALPADTSTQFLTIETKAYVDPTPPTPTASRPPSRTPSSVGSRQDASPTRSDAAYDDRRYTSDDDQESGSRSEIQSIMEQFTGDGGGPGVEEVMSPRLEITSPILGGPIQHPPRKSSLEPLSTAFSAQALDKQALGASPSSPVSTRSKDRSSVDFGPPVPPKDGPAGAEDSQTSLDTPMSPSAMHRPPPPEPEPEPVLPFDFHRFLEQLRNKKADPVARYLKSFLSEFSKRQWMVHEQVKIIGDFLAFIANKMAQCEVWRDVSDAEFDNAREGMEKLVMNRLYTQTFSPAIPAPQPIPGAKPKRRGGERPMGPGRKGQHQEDVERDDILTQKINIYGWIREAHLDIPPTSDSGKRFLKLAQQGLLKHAKSDGSADSFMPFLIYVVLQSNPEHLVSNVQYILRFRNQEKLGGEAGYYLSSLMGAIQFVENMDKTSLTITDDEFEKNVEAAVSAIAEKHNAASPVEQPLSEKVPQSLLPHGQGESSTRPSLDINNGDQSAPRRSISSDGDSDGQAPITGLLRTIQRPLSTIGRMFSEDPAGSETGPSAPRTPQPIDPNRLSPRPSGEEAREGRSDQRHPQLSVEEAAARQASAETAEAQRIQRAEHHNVVETLAGMFPDLDRDIISDVVVQKQGRVGLAVDACLALST
ncbi:hypothetical protein ACHAQA_004401 [Verticillium albo-atrum]